MIEKNRYRLGEYQISEYKDGALWWIAHHGFAEQRSGRCFIHDDILMLGQFSNEENGFLKREFLQRLKELPIWTKTKYYCFLSQLLDVSSGRSLNESWGSRNHAIWSVKGSRSQDREDESPGTFRLGKYKITVAGTKQVSWRALEGMDRVVGGKCTIQSGILFIGPKDYESGTESGHEFLNELNEIAAWKRTEIWSHGLVLRLCEPPQQTRQLYKIAEKATWRHLKFREKPVRTYRKGYQKEFKLKSLRPPGVKFKPPSWRQLRIPARFKFLVPPWPHRVPESVRNFQIPLPLLPRVIESIRRLCLWSKNHIPATPLRSIIVNWTDGERRSKTIREVIMRLKRLFLLSLILVAQGAGISDLTFADSDGYDHRHRNRYRERHGDDFRGRGRLKASLNPTYKEKCGGCHFAYQPELLPSASWERILNCTDDHFGESFEVDEESKKVIVTYLQTNAAEHSSTKRAIKIMRSLEGQMPMRISEIPYIKEKHHEIPEAIIERKSIGSLSNCTACHTRAQEGVYHDDFVVIPE
jgi:hypothetical protein